MVMHRLPRGKVKTLTVLVTAEARPVSLQIEEEVAEPATNAGPALGIDLGAARVAAAGGSRPAASGGGATEAIVATGRARATGPGSGAASPGSMKRFAKFLLHAFVHLQS